MCSSVAQRPKVSNNRGVLCSQSYGQARIPGSETYVFDIRGVLGGTVAAAQTRFRVSSLGIRGLGKVEEQEQQELEELWELLEDEEEDGEERRLLLCCSAASPSSSSSCSSSSS